MFAGKTLLDCTNLFPLNAIKKIIYNHFKDKHVKSRVWIKKIDGTRNYFLDEIKHNDVIREKYKKTCKY